ncbi:MAG: hypothetical protein PHQ90_06770 [Sulfuricurvum sp.]|uniref:hypothetical protein n=1 Tax=Sulfuricurvum sp. TaxID=2025608 RepID=UPI0026122783|nr:hypothetical protein [Sulfuricurvum sp.]MDD2368989.1 hypothetical protein [Sulfuricurvum sp.]MDD5117965.1 hypothetical protein [Sulfuricurvum sp.]
MQFRELSSTELDEGYTLLSTLRTELTSEAFDTFITAQYPKDYRPIGAYERGELRIYAGVSIRENLELGRHLIVDDFVAHDGYEHLSLEMVDYLSDYAKMYKCQSILVWGKQRGISIDDLKGFRPKRDGFIKIL